MSKVFLLQPGTRIEILLLLAKLQYALGDYSGALSKYDEVNLDNINLENVSNRRLKLLAEAYAIKGMSKKCTCILHFINSLVALRFPQCY